MKTYTKTGDKGETSLFGGKRVPKDAPRIEACGTLDELNSLIGFCRSTTTAVPELDRILNEIQNDLFTLGADLATPAPAAHAPRRRAADPGSRQFRLKESDVRRLERHIDRLEPSLAPLRNFILPGGDPYASLLHVARTVCRRAERSIVGLSRIEPIGAVPVKYVNRLSDLLFVLGRWANAVSGAPEILWQPRQKR